MPCRFWEGVTGKRSVPGFGTTQGALEIEGEGWIDRSEGESEAGSRRERGSDGGWMDAIVDFVLPSFCFRKPWVAGSRGGRWDVLAIREKGGAVQSSRVEDHRFPFLTSHYSSPGSSISVLEKIPYGARKGLRTTGKPARDIFTIKHVHFQVTLVVR